MFRYFTNFVSVFWLGCQAYEFGHRCTAAESCWPDRSAWNEFNTSISGRLITSYPSASVCHSNQYDSNLCRIAKENWTDSFWRTGQPGAYSAILWELGNDQCYINSTKVAPCNQGRVPVYSVKAQVTEDIQAAVRFADKHRLYLVIKNTGHDHLGRSSGSGAFSIWTHNLKGRQWHNAFVPVGAPSGTTGIPAVTLQAGEQWLDVYRDAAAHNVTIVGGSARTVGAAGGYLTGGGHSPFAHWYGLAVDNLLEAVLVTPTGDVKTVNKYRDPDYFWAIRGGGGSAWGVISSVTYKTHPLPTHIQAALVQINATDSSTLRTVYERGFPLLASVAAAGYTGYADMTGSFQAIFSRANGTNETFTKAFSPFLEIGKSPGISAQILSIPFPTWLDYGSQFLRDPNIATNIIDASRLLTADVLTNRTKDLVDLIFDYPELGPGFNFVGQVNPLERANTAAHPIWARSSALFSFSADWADDASATEKKQKKKRLVQISRKLGAIVGREGGTYLNEANPYEPDWQNAFWGANYPRLLKIKRRIDPKNLFVCNRCVGTDIILEP